MGTSSIWKHLSMREIIALLPHHTFSYKEKHSRAMLDNAVIRLPADQCVILNHAAISRFCNFNLSEVTRNTASTLQPPIPNNAEDCFFETVSEAFRQDCISKFIDATSNDATVMAVCAVCASGFFVQELYEVKTSNLKLKNTLAPSTPHVLRSDFTHTQIHWTASLLFSLPHTEAHVRYDLVSLSCTIRSHGLFLYDIHLRATATTILRIRGAQIPIDLVSSAMDSYRQSVVLFKPMSVPTSDPKSEFLYQSSSTVCSLQTSP